MIKRVVSLLCAFILSLGMTQAALAVDPAHPCSLTLSYTRNGAAFSGLEIEIYRVAELHANGKYALVSPYSQAPIKIHGITSQQEWQETAQTIKNYVAANQIPATCTQTTDSTGQAVFEDLQTGLYLVQGTTARDAEGTVVFHDFMVYLPTPTQNGYEYDVSAVPKYTQYTEPERYTVVKLWKDAGASAQRPESVSVDILKDGAVQESVLLSRDNNWSYSWDVSAPGGVWSVMETNVPDGYRVSIAESGSSFIITNSKAPSGPDNPDDPDDPDPPTPPEDPDDPNPPETPVDPNVPTVPGNPDTPVTPEEPLPGIPKTGDTAPLLLYTVLMCISGLALMLLGVWGSREQRHEKKR